MNGFVASLPAEKSPSWAELGLELLTREPKPNERILYTIYDECTQYRSKEYATMFERVGRVVAHPAESKAVAGEKE